MKQKEFTVGLVLLLMVLLAGCSSTGQRFSDRHITDLRIGVQDKDDISDWFGTPLSVEPLTRSARGCVERWNYVYEGKVVGMVTKSHQLVVDFYPDGKLCDHAYTLVK